MDTWLATALVGIGATAVTDAWSFLRKHVFGVPAPDFGLVGRWIGYMPGGRFRHARIADAVPLRGERAIGWTAHYAIGIAFATLLPLFWGASWFRHPSLVPALAVGIGTVLAPFLLLQPGMGAGLAARRTPRPGIARLHSLVMHAMFGLGLYLGALALRGLATH